MVLQFKTILDRVPRSVGVIALDKGSGGREFESTLRDFFSVLFFCLFVLNVVKRCQLTGLT